MEHSNHAGHMDKLRAALNRTVAITNGKGGVGKTTLAASIGGLAAAAGYRVLMIDLDPQGNLGEDFGYIDGGADDAGESLTISLISSTTLNVTITNARPNLDVICGGDRLDDLGGAMQARSQKGTDSTLILAKSLAPIADNYDLIIIDTPPANALMQNLALGAARWAVIPTKADAASIRGLAKIAQRIDSVRDHNPTLEVVGVVLFDVSSSATRVRAGAAANIEQMLDGAVPLFPTTVRSSQAVAREARDKGLLVHELAERVEGAKPFWESLRAGERPERLPGSAPALAADYVALVDSILQRIAELEAGTDVA